MPVEFSIFQPELKAVPHVSQNAGTNGMEAPKVTPNVQAQPTADSVAG
jgi:hypothetical protein